MLCIGHTLLGHQVSEQVLVKQILRFEFAGETPQMVIACAYHEG